MNGTQARNVRVLQMTSDCQELLPLSMTEYFHHRSFVSLLDYTNTTNLNFMTKSLE